MTSALVRETYSADDRLHEQITALGTEDGAGNGSPDYPVDKLEAHQQNIPHKAISIFVFQGQQLLLQKRSVTKYHSAGLWANTVCSHPLWQEQPLACAERRLQEELGWTTPLREFGQIRYQAPVGHLFENEQVHLFVGRLEADSTDNVHELFNRTEVEAVQWLSLADIASRLQCAREQYSTWFQIYMSQYRTMIEAELKALQ